MKTNEYFKNKEWLVPPGLLKKFKDFEKISEFLIEMWGTGNRNRPILIYGPTGVGKSLFVDLFIFKFARFIKKKEFPIQRINCAAFPEDLIDAELFGYKKGAFTGANTDYKGAFGNAEDGILIMEELGELPKYLQAKLLIRGS